VVASTAAEAWVALAHPKAVIEGALGAEVDVDRFRIACLDECVQANRGKPYSAKPSRSKRFSVPAETE
jgi:hypothetical protein